MIRRLNYTGRKSIPHSVFRISVVDRERVFDVEMDLSNQDLPSEAAVFVEAMTSGSATVLRFSWGTVGNLIRPVGRDLSELPGDAVIFTVKVVDISQAVGRIVGLAEGISPRRTEDAGAPRKALFPVNCLDLGEQVWRVAFDHGRPWLEVNAGIPNIITIVRSSPVFASLVFPQAVRMVLSRVLVQGGTYTSDVSGPSADWLRWAVRMHPDRESPPEPSEDEDASTEAAEAWIEHVVSGFCDHLLAKTRYVQELGHDGSSER